MPRTTTSLMLLVGALGCTGTIGEGGHSPTDSPDVAPTPAQCAAQGPAASPAILSRLSARAVDRSLEALFGEPSTRAEELLHDAPGGADLVGSIDVERQLDFGAQVGIAEGPRLQCGETTECRTRVATWGRRVWRRPLSDAELDALMALPSGRERMTRLFGSPHFHYVPEPVGDTPGVAELDGWARATRLAFALTGATPDDALLDAAAAGALETAEGVRTEGERLLGTEGGQRWLRAFFHWWLDLDHLADLDKDPEVFGDWSDAVPGLYRRELDAFVDALVAGGRLGFDDLVSATWTMENDALARYRGHSAPSSEAFVRVERDPAHHAGVLTSGAFLATHGRHRCREQPQLGQTNAG